MSFWNSHTSKFRDSTCFWSCQGSKPRVFYVLRVTLWQAGLYFRGSMGRLGHHLGHFVICLFARCQLTTFEVPLGELGGLWCSQGEVLTDLARFVCRFSKVEGLIMETIFHLSLVAGLMSRARQAFQARQARRAYARARRKIHREAGGGGETRGRAHRAV